MKNKLLLVLVSALTVGSVRSFAQATAVAPVATTPSVTVTATGSVVSQYMFRGLRLSSESFQPSVEVAAGDLTLGAWASTPFNSKTVPDSSNPEIDLYGSYTMTIEKDVTFTTGFTSYNYPKAPTSAGFYRSTFEPNMSIGLTVDGVKLTPKIYYDVVLKGFTYEMTAAYAFPMKEIGSELDLTGTYGSYKWQDSANHSSPDVKAWGEYWLLGAAMPFQIDAKSKIMIGFAYTEGRKAYTKAGSFGKTPNGLAIGRGVASISYARTF